MSDIQTPFYTIYETTNLLTAKTYIGKHITHNPDDDYLGSGKWLRSAIQKYSEEAFYKTILFIFDTEDEMNKKEAELVTSDFCKLSSNYNLCEGGKGGFGYINRTGKNRSVWHENTKDSHMKKMSGLGIEKLKELNQDKDWFAEKEKKRKETLLKNNNNEYTKAFVGRTHSKEAKQKMSESKKITSRGENNSQFGSMWITNGIENRKINKLDTIPNEWYKGRVLKN